MFGDGFTLALTSKGAWPGWLNWNPDSEVLSSINEETGPGNDDVGQYQLVWSADDGLARARYELNLIVQNTNDAPFVVQPIEDQDGKEDTIYSVDLSRIFSDVDRGDGLSYQFAVSYKVGEDIIYVTESQNWLSLR